MCVDEVQQVDEIMKTSSSSAAKLQFEKVLFAQINETKTSIRTESASESNMQDSNEDSSKIEHFSPSDKMLFNKSRKTSNIWEQLCHIWG